jgi:hypothetical protein
MIEYFETASSPPETESRIIRWRRRRRRRPLTSSSSSSSSSTTTSTIAALVFVAIAASSSPSSPPSSRGSFVDASANNRNANAIISSHPPPSLRKGGNARGRARSIRILGAAASAAEALAVDDVPPPPPPAVNAIVAAEGYIPFFGSNGDNTIGAEGAVTRGGGARGGGAVIVQPADLPPRGGTGGVGGGVHLWPDPRDAPALPSSARMTAVATSPSSSSSSSSSSTENGSSIPSANAMVAAEGYAPLLGGNGGGHSAANDGNNRNNDDNVGYEYQEWLRTTQRPRQTPQRQRLERPAPSSSSSSSSSIGTMRGNNGAHVASYMIPSPLEDLDVTSGKNVVLRPMGIDAADLTASGEGGLKQPTTGSNGGGGLVVYYYDPSALTASATSVIDGGGGGLGVTAAGGGEMRMPELTLPDVVYDDSGNAFGLETVHDGGRNDVYLEVRPRGTTTWGMDGRGGQMAGSVADRWRSMRGKLGGTSITSSSSSSSQDQLIVLFTVATMAVLVGALSARRMRSRNMLDECMHPDLDDDDLDVGGGGSFGGSGIMGGGGSIRGGGRGGYDHKKYDVDAGDSVVSSALLFDAAVSDDGSNLPFGTLLGGGRRGGYGTNDVSGAGVGGGGGGLYFRGDMEKFDV